MNEWRNLVKEVNNKVHWVMAGDFNVHNILWNCRDRNINGSKAWKNGRKRDVYS